MIQMLSITGYLDKVGRTTRFGLEREKLHVQYTLNDIVI